MDTPSPSLALIGVDIGNEVFHIVSFDADGKIASRRNASASSVSKIAA